MTRIEEAAVEWRIHLKKLYREAIRARDWVWVQRYETQIILLGRLLNQNRKPKGAVMKINDFAAMITKEEGLKKSISVAQVKEVLRRANDHTAGKIYAAIREEEI
jgi:hypothetical protein